MPTAPSWIPQEREHLAIAWIRASNNGIEGADQRSATFRQKVVDLFIQQAPPDAHPGPEK